MVGAKTAVVLTISAVVVIVLFAVAPMVCSTIEDTYTVTDTSTDGWNRTANSDLDSPATTWILCVGLITLTLVVMVIRAVIITFKDMGEL